MMEKIDSYRWKIPKSERKEMRVDAIAYGSEKIINSIGQEAFKQLTNVACLPGIVNPVIAMPDMHWGYGLPVGAIGAFDAEKGVISAGMTGFDINCGIHMLRSDLHIEDIEKYKERLIDLMFQTIPAGVGVGNRAKLSDSQLDGVLRDGAVWVVENGCGTKDDLLHMEEEGNMFSEDTSFVSQRAKARGKGQLGTLGAGNHFVEIQRVDKIYDVHVAKRFGITDVNQIVVMLHTGSRGLGHQVCTDYLKVHSSASKKYDIWLPDQQLACAPANSGEGQAYFSAMKCAVNFAFANRLMIAHSVRECFEKAMHRDWHSMGMDTIYNVAHNICKLEVHGNRELYVHRKGATRAFGPGAEGVPGAYRDVGQPVLIAGSMGTASYILVGTERAMIDTYGSTCHGAGRTMSRTAAMRRFRGADVKQALASKGIVSRATHPKVFAEEAPEVYKDVDEVVRSVDGAGISTMVARMVPVAVMKG